MAINEESFLFPRFELFFEQSNHFTGDRVRRVFFQYELHEDQIKRDKFLSPKFFHHSYQKNRILTTPLFGLLVLLRCFEMIANVMIGHCQT
jgi:hypothetical protein